MSTSNHISIEEWKRLAAEDEARKKRRAKYRARKTKIDGVTFGSAKEAQYYFGLKMQKQAGSIFDFAVHPRYKLVLNGVLITTYEADFEIQEIDGRKRVIDVKGWKDGRSLPYRLFEVKARLMKAINNINVEVV